MVSLVKPRHGGPSGASFFMLQVHHHYTKLHRNCTVLHRAAPVHGDNKAVRPAGPPPLGPCVQRGKQSGPRLRAPPAGRASALAGDPSPWPAPAAFNVARPWGAALSSGPALSMGGVVPGPPRRKQWPTARPGETAALRAAPGGPPLGRFKQPMGPTQCAHWSGRELAPCVRPPCPRPGLLPPCPPLGGTRYSTLKAPLRKGSSRGVAATERSSTAPPCARP